jgi:hypothetical protein
MKKTFIILLLLLIAVWLIGMPALVGQYVRVWVPEWLADIEATDDSQFEPGWFRSDLRISPGHDVHARLNARHMPPTGLAWLRLDGEIDIPHTAEPTRVLGHLDLNGLIRLKTDSRKLALDGPPHFQAGSLGIDFAQGPKGKTRFKTELDELAWFDELGNRLEFDAANGVMNWQVLGPDHAGLELSVRFDHHQQPTLDLLIKAAPLETNALNQLLEGIRQLLAAPIDSMARQMALLTIAGAWQELRQHGLEIQLERLALGPNTEFSGQWLTASDPPRLSGQGQIDDLVDMFAPIIGLTRGLPPGHAEHQAREWIATLVQERVLIPENGQFRLRFQPGQDFRTIQEDQEASEQASKLQSSPRRHREHRD